MEPDPLLPKTIIEHDYNGVKCAQWKVQTFFRFDGASRRSVYSINNRFNYTVVDHNIVVRDLFTGILKKLEPTKPTNLITIIHFLHLDADRGFALYDAKTTTRGSIIELNMERCSYKLIGKSYRIVEHKTTGRRSVIHLDEISRPSNNIITVKTEDQIIGARIHIFKVCLLSTLKFEKSVNVPDHCQWFNLIDGKMVFARFNPENRIDRCYLDNFMFFDIEGDNSVTEIENTATCLQSRAELNDFIIYPCGIQGSWSQNCLFVMCNFCPGNRSLATTVFFSVFEWKTKRWSELRLKLPKIDEGYVKFNINCNGILTLLHHLESYCEESKMLSHTNIQSYRLPFEKPDKLEITAWFKSKEYGLFNKYPNAFQFNPIDTF